MRGCQSSGEVRRSGLFSHMDDHSVFGGVSGSLVSAAAEWGDQVSLSIQCSRLRVKAMAARVCPWCFRVRVSGFETGG